MLSAKEVSTKKSFEKKVLVAKEVSGQRKEELLYTFRKQIEVRF